MDGTLVDSPKKQNLSVKSDNQNHLEKTFDNVNIHPERSMQQHLNKSEQSLQSHLNQSEQSIQAHLKQSEKSMQSHLNQSEQSLQAQLNQSEQSIQSHLNQSEQSIQSHLNQSHQLINHLNQSKDREALTSQGNQFESLVRYGDNIYHHSVNMTPVFPDVESHLRNMYKLDKEHLGLSGAS